MELHGLLYVIAVTPGAPPKERFGHVAARLTTDPSAPLTKIMRSASVLDSVSGARSLLAKRVKAGEPLHWRFYYGELPSKVDPAGWVEIRPEEVSAQRAVDPRVSAVPWLVAMAALDLCRKHAALGSWPPPSTSEWLIGPQGTLML